MLLRKNKKDIASNFTPEEKLEIVKEYLTEYKSHSYPEILFLIQNHEVLAKFNYGTTTLSNLFKQVKGIKTERTKGYEKVFLQRNTAWYLLTHKYKMTQSDLARIISKMGVNTAQQTIAEALKGLKGARALKDKSKGIT